MPHMAPEGGRRLGGVVGGLIDKNFGGFNKFGELFTSIAVKVEGVGWVYYPSVCP